MRSPAWPEASLRPSQSGSISSPSSKSALLCDAFDVVPGGNPLTVHRQYALSDSDTSVHRYPGIALIVGRPSFVTFSPKPLPTLKCTIRVGWAELADFVCRRSDSSCTSAESGGAGLALSTESAGGIEVHFAVLKPEQDRGTSSAALCSSPNRIIGHASSFTTKTASELVCSCPSSSSTSCSSCSLSESTRS